MTSSGTCSPASYRLVGPSTFLLPRQSTLVGSLTTDVFGPHDNYVRRCLHALFTDEQDLEQAHVIPGLIHRCFLAKSKATRSLWFLTAGNDTPFVVSGTGKPLRQFIYSRDLAKLFIWTLRKYEDIDPIILSGEPLNIKFVVKLADDQSERTKRSRSKKSLMRSWMPWDMQENTP